MIQNRLLHIGFLSFVFAGSFLLAGCGGGSSTPVVNLPNTPSATRELAPLNTPLTTVEILPSLTPSATQETLSTESPSSAVSFSKDVLPILQDNCVNCHGGEKTSKGLDLKSFASVMAGSQNGVMIVPGDPSGSKLIQSVKSGKMPKRGPALPADQIQLLVDWVSGGATNN